MSKRRLSTLIVEDDPDHSKLLELELCKMPDLDFDITACETSDAAIDELDSHEFDLVFLDYWLDGETSESVIDVMQRKRSWTPIVVTTSSEDAYLATNVIRAGAKRYLCKKDLRTQMLRNTIREAMHDAESEKQHHAAQADAIQLLGKLTPREHEVANLIADGLLSKQIGFKLGCTEGTINLHRSHIMAKTGAQSVAHLVRIVLQARAEV
jgi:FixJ family two-component response regulator